jgi:hypothetical protein
MQSFAKNRKGVTRVLYSGDSAHRLAFRFEAGRFAAFVQLPIASRSAIHWNVIVVSRLSLPAVSTFMLSPFTAGLQDRSRVWFQCLNFPSTIRSPPLRLCVSRVFALKSRCLQSVPTVSASERGHRCSCLSLPAISTLLLSPFGRVCNSCSVHPRPFNSAPGIDRAFSSSDSNRSSP